jgi:hypothetical protein
MGKSVVGVLFIVSALVFGAVIGWLFAPSFWKWVGEVKDGFKEGYKSQDAV